jgi:hypothetical protein
VNGDMTKWTLGLVFTFALAFLTGCSLSPEEKVGREQALKQTVETFSDSIVQGKWDEAFKLTDGSFENVDKLKSHLMKPWVQESILTSNQIASMAWISDTIAKVKLTWTFQTGSVESYSNETFVWIWNGSAWKYRGRSLR